MTPDTFRLLALGLANVRAGSTLGTEEFRAGGRVFATLGSPDVSIAIIKLTPQDQALFVAQARGAFEPQHGGAGARGATRVKLAMAELEVVRQALTAACRTATRSG